MLKKRGLSEIVATLLIVLLTLIAVGIVWVVIQNVLRQGAEQVEVGAYTLDLQIQSAKIENGNVILVVVRRNPGQGEFIGMNFVFSDGQNSETKRENISLAEGDTRSFTFTLTQINTASLKSISVYPIYKLRSGRETMGNVADEFDVPENKSIGGGTGELEISNFAALGFAGLGRQEYPLSTQSSDAVKFTRAIVDPLDVLPGDNQNFTVYVYSPYGIVDVTSVTQLDNSVLNLDFIKTGTDPGNSSIEIWFAEWIVNDTHGIEYRTLVTATDNNGNLGMLNLSWTDSCQSAITHGTLSTLPSCSTTIGSIEGIDGASLQLASGAAVILSSGSQLLFNSGQSITITAPNAYISPSGGSFGNANLYYTDGDGDLRAPNAVLNTNGGVRASQASSTSDCNDANINAWSNGYGYDGDNDGYGTSSYGCNNGPTDYDATLGTDCNDVPASGGACVWGNVADVYSDADQDGYSAGGASTQCVGSQLTAGYTRYHGTSCTFVWILGSSRNSDCNDASGSVWFNGYGTDSDGDTYGTGSLGCNNGAANGGDCCDSDANAKPGQTGWFTSPRTTCGGYDYNCDTLTTQQETTVSDCFAA